MAKKTNSNKTDSKTNTVENAKQSLDELHGFLDQIMNSACAKQINKLKLALKQKEDECQQKDKEIAKLKKRIQLLTKGLTGEIITCERDENSEEDIIKDDISCIFHKHGNRYGYVEYEDVSELSDSLVNYLKQITIELLEQNKEKLLFDIIMYTFKLWGKTEMDDDGDTEYFAEEIQNIIQQIVERNCKKLTPVMVLNALIQYTDEFRSCGLDEYIEDMIMAIFKTEKTNRIKLDYFKQRLIECDGSHAPSYISSHYAYNCLSIMDELEMPIEELKQYCAQFKDHCLDRDLAEIEYKRGNIAAAIQYYKKQLKTESDHCYNHQRLIELLFESGNQDEYRTELRRYILQNTYKFYQYLSYKKLFKQNEWEIEFASLINDLKTKQHNIPIEWYAEENQFDMVMDEIENQKSIYNIKQYSKELKTLYPERCLKLLKEHAQQMAENSNNRHQYQELASFLKFMKEFKGGSEIVTAMINEYRIIYKRRSAMMDELNKV